VVLKDFNMTNWPTKKLGEAKIVKVELEVKAETKPSIKLEVKRGEKSWNYFPIMYAILLAVILTIISVLNIQWFYKIILIVLSAIILFWLCFFNNWFRNKTVGLMTKSQEKVEKYGP